MAPGVDSQILEIVREMRDEQSASRRDLTEVRITVAELLAREEARARECELRHTAIDTREDRHSEGLAALKAGVDAARVAQISQLEDALETTKTDLRAPREQVSVARWQALAVLGAAALTGGVLASATRVVVTALAHAMGIGG